MYPYPAERGSTPIERCRSIFCQARGGGEVGICSFTTHLSEARERKGGVKREREKRKRTTTNGNEKKALADRLLVPTTTSSENRKQETESTVRTVSPDFASQPHAHAPFILHKTLPSILLKTQLLPSRSVLHAVASPLALFLFATLGRRFPELCLLSSPHSRRPFFPVQPLSSRQRCDNETSHSLHTAVFEGACPIQYYRKCSSDGAAAPKSGTPTLHDEKKTFQMI